MMVKRKTDKGYGMARQLGFPTANLNVSTPTSMCGIYWIEDKNYGKGLAFVMPTLTEIHFLNQIDEEIKEVDYQITSKIEAPNRPYKGILDYFYLGLSKASMDNL
tara:strand:- start:7765 stop:8079 length:315 start_codon:yes stop_codon:yes gene_type:complete